MKILTVLATAVLSFAGSSDPNTKTPVLVELFTSEGCSSCPPADALLMKLDRMQPVPNAQIVILSEHVDYWNYLGWSDPYSSAQFSQRQQMYARALNANTYTPQAVVDGHTEVLGSDARALQSAISKSASHTKTPVRIVSVDRDGSTAEVHVTIDAKSSGKADVWIAIAEDFAQSNVRRGENSGRTLAHAAVVRRLEKVATVHSGESFDKTLRVALNSSGDARAVVIVAEPGGAVTGLAMEHIKSH